jgi:hypothetical protein
LIASEIIKLYSNIIFIFTFSIFSTLGFQTITLDDSQVESANQKADKPMDVDETNANHGATKTKASHRITPGLVLQEVPGLKGHLEKEKLLLQEEAKSILLQRAALEAWIEQQKLKWDQEEAAREQIAHEKVQRIGELAAHLAAQEDRLREQQKAQMDIKLQAENVQAQRAQAEQILQAQARSINDQEQALRAAQEKQHEKEQALRSDQESQHAREKALRAAQEKHHAQEKALREELLLQEQKQAVEKNLLEHRSLLAQKTEKGLRLLEQVEKDSFIMNPEQSYGNESNFSQDFMSPVKMSPSPHKGKVGDSSKKMIFGKQAALSEKPEETDSIMTREPSYGSESNFSQAFMSPTKTSPSPGKVKKMNYAKHAISTDRKTRSATKKEKSLENQSKKSTSTFNQVIAGAKSIISSTFYNDDQDDMSEIGKGKEVYNRDENRMVRTNDGSVNFLNDVDGHENLWYFTPPSAKIKQDPDDMNAQSHSEGQTRIRGPRKTLFSDVPKSKDPKYYGELIPDHELVRGDSGEALGKRRLETISVYGPDDDSKQKDV